MSSINYNLKLVEEAKKWIGTKEDKSKGDNKGKEVEMFQMCSYVKSESLVSLC